MPTGKHPIALSLSNHTIRFSGKTHKQSKDEDKTLFRSIKEILKTGLKSYLSSTNNVVFSGSLNFKDNLFKNPGLSSPL